MSLFPQKLEKTERKARKPDDLLKRDFQADRPLEKRVTGITEIRAKDGKLYVSAMFDCFGLTVPGLSMDTNRKAEKQIFILAHTVLRYE